MSTASQRWIKPLCHLEVDLVALEKDFAECLQIVPLSSHGQDRLQGQFRQVVQALDACGQRTLQAAWEVAESCLVTPQPQCGKPGFGQKYMYRTGYPLAFLIARRWVQPSYAYLAHHPQKALYHCMENYTDREDLARYTCVALEQRLVNGQALEGTVYTLCRVMVHTGKRLDELRMTDLEEYRQSIGNHTGKWSIRPVLFRVLNYLQIGDFQPPAGHARRGRLSVVELVRREPIESGRFRQVLIRYLEQRLVDNPDLAYNTLKRSAALLGTTFWHWLEVRFPELREADHTGVTRSMGEAWAAFILANRQYPENLIYQAIAFYDDIATWGTRRMGEWEKDMCPPPLPPPSKSRVAAQRRRKLAEAIPRIQVVTEGLDRVVAGCRQAHQRAAEFLERATVVTPGNSFEFDGQVYTRTSDQGRRVLIQRIEYEGRRDVYVRWEVPVRHHRRVRSMNVRDAEDYAFWRWATVAVLAYTGLRREELSELSVDSVLLDSVCPALFIKPAKTGRSRVIPLHPHLAEVLDVILRRRMGSSGEIAPIARWDYAAAIEAPPDRWLFVWEGRPLNERKINTWLEEAGRLADLCEATGAPLRLRPHDIRKAVAAGMLDAGLPLDVVQAQLGHEDPQTTREHYAPTFLRRLTAEVQAYWAKRAARESLITVEEIEVMQTEWRTRRVGLGFCIRAWGTHCPHEYACVRCPALVPDPALVPEFVRLRESTERLLAMSQERSQSPDEIVRLQHDLLEIAHKIEWADKLQQSGVTFDN